MKKAICILIVLLLALGACAPVVEDSAETESTEPTAKDTSKETEVKTVEKVEKAAEPEKEAEEPKGKEAPERPLPSERTDEPAEEEIEVQPSEKIDPELRDLFRKSEEKIKSVTYTYAAPPLNTDYNTFNIKGDKTRVDLYRYDPYKIEEYFDTVWLNAKNQSAIGCCVEKARCISKHVDRMQEIIDVDYGDYVTKTPMDWIKDVPPTAEIVGDVVLDGKSTTFIKFNQGVEEYQMWVDQTYGIPMRVIVFKEELEQRRYMFKDVSFNSVKDEDLVPTCTQ